jgi:hypothetical protein
MWNVDPVSRSLAGRSCPVKEAGQSLNARVNPKFEQILPTSGVGGFFSMPRASGMAREDGGILRYVRYGCFDTKFRSGELLRKGGDGKTWVEVRTQSAGKKVQFDWLGSRATWEAGSLR